MQYLVGAVLAIPLALGIWRKSRVLIAIGAVIVVGLAIFEVTKAVKASNVAFATTHVGHEQMHTRIIDSLQQAKPGDILLVGEKIFVVDFVEDSVQGSPKRFQYVKDHHVFVESTGHLAIEHAELVPRNDPRHNVLVLKHFDEIYPQSK